MKPTRALIATDPLDHFARVERILTVGGGAWALVFWIRAGLVFGEGRLLLLLRLARSFDAIRLNVKSVDIVSKKIFYTFDVSGRLRLSFGLPFDSPTVAGSASSAPGGGSIASSLGQRDFISCFKSFESSRCTSSRRLST